MIAKLFRVRGPDYPSSGVFEILDRCSLAQEFGIYHHTEVLTCTFTGCQFERRDHERADSARQHCAASNDDVEAWLRAQLVSDLLRDRADIVQIQTAIL